MAFARQRRFAEAERSLRAAAERLPEDAELLARLAAAIAPLGRVEEAVTIARRALRLDPQDVACVRLASHILVEDGHVDEAQAAVDGLNEEGRESGDALDALCELALAREDYATVERLTPRLLALPDWKFRGLQHTATMQRARGQFEAACATYADLERLGQMLAQLERPAEAEVAVARTLELEPTQSRALYLQARLVAQRGDHLAALLIYSRALGLEPERGETFYWLANCWFDLGEPGAALRLIPVAVAQHPGWFDAWTLWAMCARDHGENELAAACYEAALAIDDIAPVRSDYAEVLHRLGRDAEAWTQYALARGAEPDLPSAWCGEGELRLSSLDPAVRDVDAAYWSLARALALEPANVEYRGLLERACEARESHRPTHGGGN
jgi:tetratricopeptide (TPR) repeat protein